MQILRQDEGCAAAFDGQMENMATGQVKLYLHEGGARRLDCPHTGRLMAGRSQRSGERELDQASYAVQPEFELGHCIDLMGKGVLDRSGAAARPPRSHVHDPNAYFP
jgi:hypothetical protein